MPNNVTSVGILILISCIIILSCHPKQSPEQNTRNAAEATLTVLKDELDSISYYTGVFAASNLRHEGTNELNTDAFTKGVEDALTYKNPMTKADVDYLVGLYFKKLSEKQSKKLQEQERIFLAHNKTRKEIITTPSGLQYEVIKEGTGTLPTDGCQVVVHDIGSTVGGEELVNSYKINQPDTFSLDEQIIPGLYETFHLMHVGAKYKAYLSPELGFGSNPPQIGVLKPNMSVIFEIEMLSVLPPRSENKKLTK